VWSMRGTPMIAPFCNMGYLCTRLCLSMDACQPVNTKGVTGLIRRSARALDSAVLVRSTSGTAVTHVVALAGATFVEQKVDAKGLPLAVDQVAELGAGAEGGFSSLSLSVSSRHSPKHVWMGLAEADDAEGLRLVSGTGAKGMVGGLEPSFCKGGGREGGE
jgi:hypothetical protein